MNHYALVLEPDTQLENAIRSLWQGLETKGFSRYHLDPPKFPHLTLCSLETRLTAAEISQQLTPFALREPIRLTLTGPFQFPANGAIYLKPVNPQPFYDFRQALQQKRLFAPTQELFPYRPHLTLANHLPPSQATATYSFLETLTRDRLFSGTLPTLTLLAFSKASKPTIVQRWT